jgi:hypothetical protein
METAHVEICTVGDVFARRCCTGLFHSRSRRRGRTPRWSTAPSRLGADSDRLVEVERVRVYVRDGRLQAFVEGPLGDGCTSLKGVTQTRAGNEPRIRLTSVRVGEVCTMMLS